MRHIHYGIAPAVSCDKKVAKDTANGRLQVCRSDVELQREPAALSYSAFDIDAPAQYVHG